MRKITNQELCRPTAEQFAASEKIGVTVVLDNIRSAQNIGAFFRTADAFAIGGIALCGFTATPPNRDIHKSALGAESTVAWSHHSSTIECVQQLKEQGYTALAIEQVQGATMLHQMSWSAEQKYALIFGNEVNGVEQEVVDICDGAIEIPQAGTKHSINVSVAGGVVLWSAFEQLQTKKL